MSGRVVMIGYGNELRGDDGVGPRAARAVAGWGLPNVETLAVHQLTPELAESLSGAGRVVFVDAGPDDLVQIRPLAPTMTLPGLGHVGDPAWLLGLTGELYGRRPAAWLMTVPAPLRGFGEDLSPQAAHGLGVALRLLRPLCSGVMHFDLPYIDGPEADTLRHCLDLYLPQSDRPFPVLVFVHGGGYRMGDRKEAAHLGASLAAEGMGLAAVGYRLFPQTCHPGQIEDVARALAWVVEHIARWGGDVERLFVGGYSAGAHLASLLLADGRYLARHGLRAAQVCGAVALSGGYRVGQHHADNFGGDEGLRRASPLELLAGPLPPFLIVYADGDVPGRDRGAAEFATALRQMGGEAEVAKVAGRDHLTLLTAMGPDEPGFERMLAFLRRLSSERE